MLILHTLVSLRRWIVNESWVTLGPGVHNKKSNWWTNSTGQAASIQIVHFPSQVLPDSLFLSLFSWWILNFFLCFVLTMTSLHIVTAVKYFFYSKHYAVLMYLRATPRKVLVCNLWTFSLAVFKRQTFGIHMQIH